MSNEMHNREAHLKPLLEVLHLDDTGLVHWESTGMFELDRPCKGAILVDVDVHRIIITI